MFVNLYKKASKRIVKLFINNIRDATIVEEKINESKYVRLTYR